MKSKHTLNIALKIFLVITLSFLVSASQYGFDNPNLPRIDPPSAASSSSGGGSGNLTNVAFTNESNVFTKKQTFQAPVEINDTLNAQGEFYGAREVHHGYLKTRITSNGYLNLDGYACTGTICLKPARSGSIRELICWGELQSSLGSSTMDLTVRVDGVDAFNVSQLYDAFTVQFEKNRLVPRYEYNFTSNSTLSTYANITGSSTTISDVYCAIGVQYDE